MAIKGGKEETTASSTEGTYVDLVMCNVISLNYNYADKELTLYLEEYNCVDMRGTIILACRIDSNVKRIQTFAGEMADVCYVKTNGKWEAVMFKRARNGN